MKLRVLLKNEGIEVEQGKEKRIEIAMIMENRLEIT